MEKRRVVITGMGTVNPIGHNVAESWQAVRDGVCGIGPITQYDSSAQKVHLAAEVKDWDPTAVIDKREVRHMARYTQFAVASAKEAVADSGVDLDSVDRTRCGVIVSSGIGGISTTESEQTRCLQRGFDKASPFYIPSSIANMAAGQIAITFGFKGMCSCPVSLRRRLQRGGGRLPPHPGRLRRDDAVRRRRSLRHPAVHRRLHLDAGAARRRRPRPRLHPL